MATPTIRPKDRDAVLQALRAGVVPRAGQHLIQVGRAREIESMLDDVDRVADGGSAFRVIVGEYGAGKTFFLNLIRTVALEKKLVVANADLNPDRRLHATGGQARSLYAELMRSLATRAKPEGGALAGVVEKFIAAAVSDARASGQTTESVIRKKLDQLTELVNGYVFADVIAAYYRGHETDNEQLKSDAVRWLRGEFGTKTEAREALGVRAIIDDAGIYEQMKLMARFVRLAGYGGLLVNLDELVNLYKLSNSVARKANYEQILRMLNDSFQGISVGLGIVLGGTPEFLTDGRRGLYSYEALQGRLAQNAFARDGLLDLTGPVLRLSSLSQEDFYVLLHNVRHVYASGQSEKYLISDVGIQSFMAHCAGTLGDGYFRTPRTSITAFINLLAVLDQNPGTTWESQIGQTQVSADTGGTADKMIQPDDDEEFSSFKM